ncbi:tail fiber domain-containing protein [Pseudomonas sp. MF5691]|uniref:phage tail fiber domain-containing protein n=1 Tax=Pseudomonas sp. MF5691 TaxID=2797526 RepID=UPI0018E6FD19|nr:phage tail fiber protein [Pseudomonas sp. MF5691]MBJ2290755.1 tail fiber domain-containing protein [Pseudomonas sp. MF5691]
MTVNTISSIAEFDTNGVTTNFPFYFKFLANEDLVVTYVDPLGVSSTLTLGTHYTVNGAGNDQGGSIVTTSALAGPGHLIVSREMEAFQQTSLRNQGKFLAETHEDVFDKLTMLIQQGFAIFKRALTRPLGRDYFFAENRRITALADPVEPQDAVNKISMETYVGEVVGAGTGPINLASNVIYIGPDGVPVTVQDMSNKTDPLKGVSLFGMIRNALGAVGRTLYDFIFERINAKDFGAQGTGGDDTSALQAAINHVESLPAASLYPYILPAIHLPPGQYGITKALRAQHAIQFEGDGAIIIALPGFVGETVTKKTGGTTVINAMIVYLHGLLGDVGGRARRRARIGRGVTLHCNENAETGIFIERMNYTTFPCQVEHATGDAVQVGTWCWGFNANDITLEHFAGNGINFLPGAAANGSSIIGALIWGGLKTGNSAINFMDGAECNGVEIAGGFTEKLLYGVRVGAGNGAINVNGMDMEFITYNTVWAVGDMAGGRLVGPINVTGNLLHTTAGAKLYADGAFINATGNRLFAGSDDFGTDVTRRGIIHAKNNEFAGGIINITPGSNVSIDQHESFRKVLRNYMPHKAAEFREVFSLRNYQYQDAPFLQSSGLNFTSYYVGGAAGQYVSRSDWWISEYQHATAPGTLHNVIGVRLANDSGQLAFDPMSDNKISCGEVSARFSFFAAASGTIVTSDEREKQQIRPVSDREHAVAVNLKSMLKAFKFNSAVEEKGDGARIHFGVIAQDVKAAFELEGLVAEEYAILCHNTWGELWRDVEEVREVVLTTEETPAVNRRGRPVTDEQGNQVMRPIGSPVLDADGNPVTQVVTEARREKIREPGERYGIRYEELLAFIISAI